MKQQNMTFPLQLSISPWKNFKQTFLAFLAADFAIMSSTLIFRKSSCSIDKRVRLFKRSWLIDMRYSCLMRFSLKKYR